MRSERKCRPGVESMADRIVLSHVNPAVSLAHIDTTHVHFATLTFKGTYFATSLIGPNLRYIGFETPLPVNVSGLGPVRVGGHVDTHVPGLALPVHPRSGDVVAISNFGFVGAPASPGSISMQYGKKVKPVTKGFTFDYTVTITLARGEFAGAQGGGKVEVKLVPKPPLTASAPPQADYMGKCTVRFHFSPSTVLT
jgi:hypothetical protein